MNIFCSLFIITPGLHISMDLCKNYVEIYRTGARNMKKYSKYLKETNHCESISVL